MQDGLTAIRVDEIVFGKHFFKSASDNVWLIISLELNKLLEL